MSEHQVQRTLVKSPPELWAEVSDPESLGRRLAALGEIEITGTEPETTVAWEGEKVSGTVELAKSGWGTKVTIEATLEEAEVTPEPESVPEPVAEAQPEPEPDPKPEPVAEKPSEPRPGFFARLFGQPTPDAARAPEPVVVAEPEAVKPPEVEPKVTAEEPAPEPVAEESAEAALDGEALEAALNAALDDLGAAHHRPFSRS